MAQFETTRMNDNTPVSEIDNKMQLFEDSVVYAFGLPTGSALTGKIFPSTDVDGNITGIFRSAAAPAPGSNTGPGWRVRDTTNDDEFLIMCNDGYLRIYENTGSQSSPTWTERNKMQLSDGAWDVGGANAADFAGCRASMSSYETVTNNNYSDLTMDTQLYDSDGYFTPSSSEFVVPSGKAGYYQMNACVYIDPIGSPNGKIDIYIKVGGYVVADWEWSDLTASDGFTVSISGMYYMAEGANAEVRARNYCGVSVEFTIIGFSIHLVGA